MDFSLSEDQKLLKENVEDFARQELNAHPVEGCEFPWDNWRRCADHGLLGLLVDEEYGGADYDCLTAAIILEALGYAAEDHGVVHAISTQLITSAAINRYGSPEQKAKYLPGICDGSIVASQAMTEPDAGSDTSGILAKAVPTGDEFRLSGSKTFITNGPIADMAIVWAVTNPDAPSMGRLSCLFVDKGREGFEQSKPMEKLGLHTLQNGNYFFDNCVVTQDDVLGRLGAGQAVFNETMVWERILLFATQVGKLRTIFEIARTYARERRQFGKPISEFQSISHKIADIRVHYELAQLITYKAAWLKDQGKRASLESSIGKLFISETCKAACLDLIQIHGGFGYMEESGLGHQLFDALGGTIYSGTSEIHRNIIASLSGV